MTTPANQLDLVTVLIAAATAIFGSKELAEYVGPYAVIVLASVVGAAFSAASAGVDSPGQVLMHMLLVVFLAVLVTVPLSIVVAYVTPLEARWAFGPVALLIGWRNKRLPDDFDGVWRFFAELISEKLKSRGPKE